MTRAANLEHCFVITGPPGSGKTPILNELAAMGYAVVPEPAREIIAEQRAIGIARVYDHDPRLFWELMLSRAVSDFEAARAIDSRVFFDRGIPDLIGHAALSGHDPSAAMEAAGRLRYNDRVFALPSWPEIYVTDEDRRMTFEAAAAFGEHVRQVYADLNYTIIDVPRDSVSARVEFILETLRKHD